MGSRSPRTSSTTSDQSGSSAATIDTTRTPSHEVIATASASGGGTGREPRSGPVTESNGLRARMGSALRGGIGSFAACASVTA
jgi:hypothetical protein